jgi:dienelactone hydrolase
MKHNHGLTRRTCLKLIATSTLAGFYPGFSLAKMNANEQQATKTPDNNDVKQLNVKFISSADEKLTIPAILKKPKGNGPFPAVVLMAGCSPEFFNNIRESTWASRLLSWGCVTIQPESWGPRNDSGVCTRSEYLRIPWMAEVRALDAFDAKAYLAKKPFVVPDRIAVMGWSHGGWTVLAALRPDFTFDKNIGPFRAGVAFYPYCMGPLDKLNAPLLILHGEKDRWAPAETCAENIPKGETAREVIHHVYPDAYHDFDWPGADETFEGQRLLYNPVATKLAIGHVKGFLTEHLGL